MTIDDEPLPSPHTPLCALPALALDLETTGLDVRNARVVQIGALAMHGATVQEGAELDQLIRPDIPIPPAATRLHGLGDAQVARAPRFAELAGVLRARLRGRVVVGHHIGFDLAVLRFEAARAEVPWSEPLALDIALLAGALEPALRIPGLETVMARLGIALEGRHTAMGDCRTAARAWARLAVLLHDAGIRTLGEAQAFAARRDDLLLRQAQDGWHDVPPVRKRGFSPSPSRGRSREFGEHCSPPAERRSEAETPGLGWGWVCSRLARRSKPHPHPVLPLEGEGTC